MGGRRRGSGERTLLAVTGAGGGGAGASLLSEVEGGSCSGSDRRREVDLGKDRVDGSTVPHHHGLRRGGAGSRDFEAEDVRRAGCVVWLAKKSGGVSLGISLRCGSRDQHPIRQSFQPLKI